MAESITIIGAGASGLALADKLRAEDPKRKVRLIDKNTSYLSKSFFIDDIKEAKNKTVDLNKWTKDKQIDFINDCVERINIKRKKIYFKTSEPVDFEKLVVSSGLASRKLPIKGDHREGFFYLSSINPVEFNDILRISQEICLYVSTWLGIKFALNLRNLDKDIRIISENLDFLGEDKEKVISVLKEKGIVLNLGLSAEETIGEGMVKAVKTLPLKVFSCQVFIVDSGFEPNLKFFEEGINIRDIFFSEFENLYFLGDVNNSNIGREKFFIHNYYDCQQQGIIFADFLLKDKNPEFNYRDVQATDIKTSIERILREGELWQSGLV